MKNENILLSIIIPTKDRYETLIPVIKSILEINSNKLELVIQDNSSDNSPINLFLNNYNDNRIKYFHSADRISQGGNSDLALRNSKGEYVCFIGDDDAVLPYILDIIEWMSTNCIGILKGSKPIYYWPGMPTTSTSSVKNGSILNRNFDYKIKKINCLRALKETLNIGGVNMNRMPCLYHGIVKKSILDTIYSKVGSCFPGPSPDMANAVALCLSESDYTYVDFPIVISGKSNKSIGGQGVKHNHVNHIDKVAHLPKDTSDNWSKLVPKYWTGPTIWAESILKSLTAFDEKLLIKKMNIDFLIATIYVFHFNQRKIIFKGYIFPKNRSRIRIAYYILQQITIRTRAFVLNRFYFNKSRTHNNVVGIDKAILKIMESISIDKLPI